MSEREPRDEDAAARTLATVLAPRIDALMAGASAGDSHVEPGSALAGDDRLTSPYELSHAAWRAICQAVDNLHALRSITVVGDHEHVNVNTHPYAAYPLIRAALENASQAAWLVGPSNRNVRLTRRFRLLLTDATNLDKVAGLTRVGSNDERGTRWERVRPTAEARELDLAECQRHVGNAAFVRGAAEVVGGEPDQAEALWRALSGLSHGDQWASMLTDRSRVGVSADGKVGTYRTTSSFSTVANLLGVAISTTEAAVRLFDRARVRQL
jgi:hypothetical protein